MDYENCHSNQTVTLAVVKRPAKDMDNYMGPVFVNPGVSIAIQTPESHMSLLTFHDRDLEAAALTL